LTANLEQDESSEYYYGNSMTHFVKLMQDALPATFDTINYKLFFYWNSETQKLEVNAEQQYFSDDLLLPQKLNVYFNRELQSLFSTLSYDRYTDATLGKFYRLQFPDVPQLRSTFPGNIIALLNKQEFSTISNISPVTSIVFTSSTLPIVANQLSTPIISVNGNTISSGSNSNFLSIISDLQVNDQFYKPNILYNPSAEYRFLDLISSQPINNIDIRCWWKTKTGNFKPFYLFSNGSASMKLLFRKKNTDYILATAEQNL